MADDRKEFMDKFDSFFKVTKNNIYEIQQAEPAEWRVS